jgi:hypothetical protein
MIKLLLLLFSSTFAYDETISKQCVDLSQAAYSVSSLDDWNCITCDPSLKLEYIVEEEGSRAIQGFDPTTNTIFTSFRGSSNINNWMENIQIKQISPYTNQSIKIEKGFYKAYNFIKPQLIENLGIMRNKYKTKQLLITGHSLGAAMATLMTYDILTLFTEYEVKYLVNFGSPRVGNLDFVDSYNSYNITSYRITHHYDMIPHLPEELFDYLHIPNEIWYNEQNNEYKICDDSNNKEDNTCSNSCAPLHCTSTSDHMNYLNVSMGNSA